MREQLLKPAALKLTGLLEAWDTEDPQTRHELLLALFEGPRIKDGDIGALPTWGRCWTGLRGPRTLIYCLPVTLRCPSMPPPEHG